MRQIAFFLTLCGAVSAQSMLEGGGILAGSAVGSAAGKKLSQGVTTTLTKVAKTTAAAGQSGARQQTRSPRSATPLIQVSSGVPKAEPNNVPPPPPRRAAAARPVRNRTVPVPMVMASVLPEPPPIPSNVDLSGVQKGMLRDSVLALGNPSARITMFEDGHILEIYQYRNQTVKSGTVRLRDGEVWAIEARP